MNKLNPNNEVVQAADDQWHKIVGLVMLKLGVDCVEITLEDLERLGHNERAVLLDCRNDSMKVRLISMAEAEVLARQAGGLPL